MEERVVFLPIRQLSQLVRSRQVSPVDLAETFLARLENIGPTLNAVVTVTRELAMRQARQAEREIAAGTYRGPLHGIPYGAKDLLATSEGIPTTWGAAPFRARRLDHDATVVRRLRDAGAVLAAKLAMVELAGGFGYRFPNASFTGPAVNPWSRGAWTGGSSTGSAASVSAGLVPFAIGSETWGSILSPASICGVAGLRPTYGRVSRYGAMALSWTLDKLGPLCLTADDCGLVLEAIAGPDPLDPTTHEAPFNDDPGGASGRPFRLGVLRDATDGVHDDVRDNFHRALGDLEGIATVEEVTLPDLPYEAVTRTILMAESASAFDEFIESGGPEGLTDLVDRYGGYARTTVLAKDYLRALRIRGLMARAADGALARLDALAAPSRRAPAPAIDEALSSPLSPETRDIMGALGNGAGLPSISVPNGFTHDGLPTGVQFMARAYQEDTALAVARAYQTLTGWHRRHPPEFQLSA